VSYPVVVKNKIVDVLPRFPRWERLGREFKATFQAGMSVQV
jgi:hypothetical protein